MDVLLREKLAGPGQSEEFNDRELSGEPLTIGSSQRSTLQLIGAGVLGLHATLTRSGGDLTITCSGRARLKLDGKDAKSAKLGVGDSVEIGGHRLTRIQAPAGFDAALELHRNPDVDSASFEQAYHTRLEDTWLGKRAPAWVLLALVVLLGLGIPLWLVLDGNEDTPDEDAKILTDAIWTSGPLHAIHNQAIGNDCQACHTELFKRVPDEACEACHKSVADHVVPGHASLAAAPTERCATCHKEHNEPTLLVISADTLCTDCHAEPDKLVDRIPHMKAVTAFDEQNHPAFEIALDRSRRDDDGAFVWDRHEVKLAGAEESSNLKFPHQLHLAGEKVKWADGEAMGCGDCHTLSSDREHFQPVTMEKHCRECHELTFDAASPGRQLPHGQPHEAVAIMEAHFIRYYANPSSAVVPKPRERRRRPNQAHQPAPVGACTQGATQCAIARTRQEAESQFLNSGCATCHEVDDNGGSDVYTRFTVLPVKLSHDFMPTAKFDHHSHLTQKDASGDAACGTCHAAETSESSHDVLIPDIDNCASCHNDAHADESVPLDCIACHAYHPSANPLGGKPPEFLERSP